MALKSQGILYEIVFLLIGKQEKKMNLEETEVQDKRKTRGSDSHVTSSLIIITMGLKVGK